MRIPFHAEIGLPLSKDDVIVRIAGLAIIVLFFIAARAYDPFGSRLIACQFKDLTGYDCPTCGISRSVHLLMHFQISDSIAYHPLGVVAAAALLVLVLKFTVELFLQRKLTVTWKKKLV